MESNQTISLRGISKVYNIYNSPRDRLKQGIINTIPSLHRIWKQSAPLYREHWALKNINFDLRKGEAIGILGKNGAGKSTLLQIIAGTVIPSNGIRSVNGRITALLELGSGFNPEFNGEANVMLNAQILGLSHKQALDKYDEILAFADIGDFISQPVKTYSSGMMMRLAFAVQSILDPQILIVDEALAVGDMFFQSKCMKKIKALLDSGVSLLYVSHDPGSVRQLCSRAMLLNKGEMVALGSSRDISDQYSSNQMTLRNNSNILEAQGVVKDKAKNIYNSKLLDNGEHKTFLEYNKAVFDKQSHFNRVKSGDAEVINILMLKDKKPLQNFHYNDKVVVRVYVHFLKRLTNVCLMIHIRNKSGLGLVSYDTRLEQMLDYEFHENTTYCFDWNIFLPFMTENYHLSTSLAQPPSSFNSDWFFLDCIANAYNFNVAPEPNMPFSSYLGLRSELTIEALS